MNTSSPPSEQTRLPLGGEDVGSPDRYREETRAAQLDETLKLAKYSNITPIAVAAAFVPFFWTTQHRTFVLILLVLATVPGSLAVLGAEYYRKRIVTAREVTIGRMISGATALLMGLVWGAMPIVLFASSDADHRLIVVGTFIGVTADVYALGPILPVCFLFAAPIVAGGFIGLMISQELIAGLLALLLLVYAAFIGLTCRLLHKLSVERITDRLRVSEQNETIGLLLRDFEENTSDWLWDIDAEGRLRHVSERVASAAGLPVKLLKNAAFETIFTNRSRSRQMTEGAQAVFRAIAARRPFNDQIVEVKTLKSSIWWKLTGKPIYDKSGVFGGYRGVGSDTTAERLAEARIAFMANFDGLTGLANRSKFLGDVQTECELAWAEQQPRALLYLDLDGFKGVNDSLGHAAGDALLVDVAKRLQIAMPHGSIVARLGGDEFAVVCKVIDIPQLEMVALSLIESLSIPYLIQGSRVDIGASIGIALAPDHARDPDALLVKADLALYRAKAEGRGCFRLFVDAYEISIAEKRAFESDLKLAIARGELDLHYQPLVDLSDGHINCFEALIRWTSPTRGAISPVDFIPAAESIGLIVSIGRWVLRQACAAATQWPDDIKVAVNISPQHFRDTDFVRDVLLVLETTGLEPGRLEIEITEGVFLDNCSAAVTNLHALRSRGIRIALDDFGTGYSSLNYLINFPVDKIKIDRSFVTDFMSRRENRAIIEAILTLAKELSIRVTAEGVETIEQAMALKARHCDDVQGFLLSKPRPVADIPHMLAHVPTMLRDVSPLRLSPSGSRAQHV
jgi:diguanylate cyclase (GGDEF)-like protein